MRKTLLTALSLLAFLGCWLAGPAQGQDTTQRPPTVLEIEIGRTVQDIQQRTDELSKAQAKLRTLLAAYYL